MRQYDNFKKDNNWLFCNVGKLGGSVCRDVVNVDDKINVSQEWSHCEIVPYGQSRAAQQTSLRKKMHDHRVSVAHKTAVNIMQTRDEEQLKAAVAQQMQHQHDEMCRVFVQHITLLWVIDLTLTTPIW